MEPEPQDSLSEAHAVAVDQDPDELPHTELATVLEREHRAPVWRARLFWGLVASLLVTMAVLAVVEPGRSDPPQFDMTFDRTELVRTERIGELRDSLRQLPCDANLTEELHRLLVLDGKADEAIALNHRFAVACPVDSPP